MNIIRLYLVGIDSPDQEIVEALKQVSAALSKNPSILRTRPWDQRDDDEVNPYHFVLPHEIHEDGVFCEEFRNRLERLAARGILESKAKNGILRFRPRVIPQT